jgi:nicotinamide-nucleotide amidase
VNILNYFKLKNKTLGSVESFTGGLFAKTITSKPGASLFYKGSLITYSNEVKETFGISTINGTINKKTALLMAKKGKKILKVDVCVSFTGNAGPKTLDDKPIGIVYIAINKKVYELKFKGTRKKIREKAVKFAIKKLNKL